MAKKAQSVPEMKTYLMDVQALSSPDDTAEKLAALDGIAAFFRGEDDSCGLPEHFDRLAGYEAVDVTLNARTIRAVLAATAKAAPPKEGT